MSRPRCRWLAVLAASSTLAAVPAIAPPLAPKDRRVVDAANVALTAGATPGPQSVIDDFARGGLAEVLRVQATSRLHAPYQTQIIDDFFQGGVIQTEGHRFLQLFNDPQQQEFIDDVLTGGVIQMVRNRLLDETGDPALRNAIIDFFPDEVTDYRGGPITMIQRRLIAAAKGDAALIGLVNAVFDNPVVLSVRHLIGGGPVIGTPLHELPPLQEATPPAATAVRTSSAERAPTAVDAPGKPSVVDSATVAAPVLDSPPKRETADDGAAEPATAELLKTGNKVEPTTVVGGTRRRKAAGNWGVFGQVAESIVKTLAGTHTGAGASESPPADTTGATATDTNTDKGRGDD